MEQTIGKLNENEMELLHNALYVYLQYLQTLNKLPPSQVSQEVVNVVTDTYVDAKALRTKLIAIAGGDLTEANATEVTDTLGEMLDGNG